MAGRVVAAAGVPHTPVFPRLAALPEGADIRERYAAVRRVVEQARPDVLCLFHGDHINAYFLDNWPNLAVTVADGVSGPVDEVPGVPGRRYPVAADLAAHVYGSCLAEGFAPALAMDRPVDHGAAVPLHFLNATLGAPIVPIHVNGVVAPLPPAAWCRRLGAAVARALRAWDGDLRVAVVASGSFSLEVGGPAVAAGVTYGVPRPDWARRVCGILRANETDELVEAATPRIPDDAGTVAGELLSWVAALGASEGLEPVHVDHREGEGHAFVAWSE